ncbi:MAG: hypothetical protein ACOC3G_00545 [Phycisphaeraceae bacterium]
MIDSTMFGYDGNMTSTYASSQAASASSAASAASRTAQQVEERHERLALVCMAMWSLLMDKTNLTERDLIDRMKMLDTIDGTSDGKATRTITQCTACKRTVSPRHQKCLYCGQEKLASSAFDLV